ncbi:MAG: AsnC family transcriptional regulator [Thermoplasmata archaeon]|nr:MAG: AsnC family transcriptional regulator [Thermoplasmata archaeon]
MTGKRRKTELDEMDLKILHEYLKDSRASSREISRRLKTTPGTVISRTRRMERLGIIKGYSVKLDYEKLGYEITVVTEFTVSKGKLVDVEKRVARIPQTVCVYDVTGDVDAIVVAKFRSREELSKFTKELLSIPYVERTNTHVVLNTVKEDFTLPL